MKVVSSWSEVPQFDSIVEEQRYWNEHQLNPSLLQAACIKASSGESTTITLRMDPRMLARLKRIAGQRYLNYQSMLKQWVAER